MAIIRNGLVFAFEDVAVCDFIVFYTEDGGGRTIVHRVVKIYSDTQTGESWLRGDNNPKSYEGFDYLIKRENYYGKVVSVICKIGILNMTLRLQDGG